MSKKRALEEMQKEVEQQIPGHLFKPITQQDREKITNEIKATILEQRKKDEEVNKKEEESDDDELAEITGRMSNLGSSRKKRKKRKPKTNRKKHTKKRKIKKRKSTRKK